MEDHWAMNKVKVKIKIDTEVDVPLDTLLEVRNGSQEPSGFEAVMATLKRAAIEAMKAYPEEVPKAETAAAAIDAEERMYIRIQRSDKNRITKRYVHPDTTISALIANFHVTRKLPATHRRLVQKFVAFNKKRDDYVAEEVVLRGSTKLRNMMIRNGDTLYLVEGRYATARPEDGPAIEEKVITFNIMDYNDFNKNVKEYDTSEAAQEEGDPRQNSPEARAERKILRRDPENYVELACLRVRPTTTFMGLKEALFAWFDGFEVSDTEFYKTIEDMEAGRQADDEQTLDEAGITHEGKVYA